MSSNSDDTRPGLVRRVVNKAISLLGREQDDWDGLENNSFHKSCLRLMQQFPDTIVPDEDLAYIAEIEDILDKRREASKEQKARRAP